MAGVTADTTPVFPACPTFGFTAEPMYRVAITQRDGGQERRDRKWSRPLHRYSGVPLGDQAEADMQDVLYFWHVMGGNFTKFRFKDWDDYKNCKIHQTPAAGNAQPLVLISGLTYQLTKRYAYGSATQDREITRPIGSTVAIYNEFGVVQDASKWTLVEATGVLTKGGSFTGTPTGWAGEFDVPCRFDGDLSAELTNHKIQRITASICEVRE